MARGRVPAGRRRPGRPVRAGASAVESNRYSSSANDTVDTRPVRRACSIAGQVPAGRSSRSRKTSEVKTVPLLNPTSEVIRDL